MASPKKAKNSKENDTLSEGEFLKRFDELSGRKQHAKIHAKGLKYSRKEGLLLITLSNGNVFGVMTDSIPELRGASSLEIAKAELAPMGHAIFWNDLDVHYTVARLYTGAVPASWWATSLGMRGGSVRSETKAIKSRINGLRGGRPSSEAAALTRRTVRDLGDTGSDKRLVRRDASASFSQSADVGRSLSRDVRHHAKTKASTSKVKATDERKRTSTPKTETKMKTAKKSR